MTKRTVFKGEANQASPLLPAPMLPSDMDAIRALVAGTADGAQQRAVVRWLMLATDLHGLAFRADQRLTDFALGKQWVGRQFYDIANSQIKEVKHE